MGKHATVVPLTRSGKAEMQLSSLTTSDVACLWHHAVHAGQPVTLCASPPG